jgi:ABC-type uncharacterized transport system substrate-binding protein
MTIDVEAIDTLGTDMAVVAADFSDANAASDGIAAAVGHAGLAETVRGFAHKWDDTRAKMVESMNALSEASAAVAQAWRDIDQQGADALTGEGQPAAAPPVPMM